MAEPTPRKGVAERIARTLRSSIVKGRFRPGDALPSERELAEKYDVNRSSIREALKRLEAWGLVQIRQGGATRVTDFLLSAGLELLPHLMEAGSAVDPTILSDLHEIRAMLLGWCAEQAAEKADAASMARLDELVRKMVEAKGKPHALQELDYDFFQELITISGNRVMGLFSNVVRDVYLKGREHFVSLYAKGVFDPLHHKKTVEAIRERDPLAAAAAMRAHARSALESLEARA
jgi:fatty acid metabolism transcriptional regulator FadR